MVSYALDLPLWGRRVGVSVHAHQMIFSGEACRSLLSEGLVVGLAHSLAISCNVATLEGHLVPKLRPSQVLSLIFDYYLVEQVVFLVEILLAEGLHGVALVVRVLADSVSVLCV